MVYNICDDPDFLQIIKFIYLIINIIRIVVPLAIIIISSLDAFKIVTSGTPETVKEVAQKLGDRIIAAAAMFYLPTVVYTAMDLVNNQTGKFNCFTKISQETISYSYLRRADAAVSKAEKTLLDADYANAFYYVSELNDSTEKDNYIARLNIVKKLIQMNPIPSNSTNNNGNNTNNNNNNSNSNTLVKPGSTFTLGNGVCEPGVVQNSEPDPSAAINYWGRKGYINTKNFYYPKDDVTGLPLGAWPNNANMIPTNIANFNTYQNGILMFPVTVVNGIYQRAYIHNGIDLMAVFGTPVYSPVNGTLTYSEWGHTVNKGGDETAYTVSIELDKPFYYNGVNVDTAYLTHMSGIRYRCARGTCNRKIKQGELLGFVGNAAGDAYSIGWAPHLHLTLYNSSNYNTGLLTDSIENIYNLAENTQKKVGE